MNYLKVFIIVGVLATFSFLIFDISRGSSPKKVESASLQPSPQVTIKPTPDESTIPQGKFYAPILAYHHIALKRPQNSYYVSPEIFDKQMKWLSENNYKVVSMDKFYDALIGRGKLPPKPVVITFDDGLKDQYTNAFPILKKYGYTATFFIKLNNLNKGGMNWDNLKELQSAGNIIGSHSVNHDNMAYMPPTLLNNELVESKKVLEQNLGTEVKYFCYPGGEYSSQTISALKSSGYLAATTTKHKVEQEYKDSNSPYTLPRVHIDDEMPTFIDWVQGKNLR